MILRPSYDMPLYRLGTPVQMTEQDQISHLLKAKGIKPEEINYVLLSHLHPDHLGGASFFPIKLYPDPGSI